MYISKKLDVQKITSVFKEIHYKNSDLKSSYDFEVLHYYKISPPNVNKFNKKYNKLFPEIKFLLENIEKDYKEQLNNQSFIFLDKSRDWLNIADYLNIAKKSNSYFQYLTNLFESGYTSFLSESLDYFCSKYMFNDYIPLEITIEIKEIRYKKTYLYLSEQTRFKEIDYNWEERNYKAAIEGCDSLLSWFIGKLREKFFQKTFFTDGYKSQEIEKCLEKLTSDCKLLKLKESLNKIIKEFKVMRNKLGKDKPSYESDEDWEKFNNLPEPDKKLYVRIIIDLLKTIHNTLIILDAEKEKFDGSKNS